MLFSVCSVLSQDMGYRGGDLGYQTFLYSNEAEIRRIFMFLVEKLPKDSSQTADAVSYTHLTLPTNAEV